MKLQETIDELLFIAEEYELNNLHFVENGKIEFLVNTKKDWINPIISETEYNNNLGGFIDKLKKRIPLLREGKEDVKSLTKDDFIYYE